MSVTGFGGRFFFNRDRLDLCFLLRLALYLSFCLSFLGRLASMDLTILENDMIKHELHWGSSDAGNSAQWSQHLLWSFGCPAPIEELVNDKYVMDEKIVVDKDIALTSLAKSSVTWLKNNGPGSAARVFSKRQGTPLWTYP